MRVTPVVVTLRVAARPRGSRLLIFPTDDIGIQSFAAGLAIAAETDDVGLVAVVARELVDVVVAPRIFGNVLRHVWPVPLVGVLRFQAQRLQTLPRGGDYTGVPFVSAA